MERLKDNKPNYIVPVADFDFWILLGVWILVVISVLLLVLKGV